MAFLTRPKTEKEIKELTHVQTRKEYLSLASAYTKVINNEYVCCPKCGRFLSRTNFYSDNRFFTKLFPICKDCVLAMVERRSSENDESHESKETVKSVLKLMNLPYLDNVYKKCCDNVYNNKTKRVTSSPFIEMVSQLKSLPQWSNLTWEDSDLVEQDDDAGRVNKRLIADGKKNFGRGYPNEDYMYLEDQYEDWLKRYEVNTKSQEVLFQRVCCKQLELHKAQIAGLPTKDLDKALQELLSSLNIKPSQSNSDQLTDAKTFGQLIQLWENEKPIPEPEEDFKDIDNIGVYIDVFFKGHLSKIAGIKNAFNSIYERFMAKYTVKKPEYDEDVDSEVLFNKIFGDAVNKDS